MTHARTQIVSAIAEMLNGLETTQNRVNKTKVYSRDENELPSISIFFDGEVSQPATLKGGIRMYRRVATINIVGHAFAYDDVETLLDTIAAEVETAMSQDIVINSRQIPATLTGTTITTASTEQQIGEIALVYQVMYATSEDSPTIIL